MYKNVLIVLDMDETLIMVNPIENDDLHLYEIKYKITNDIILSNILYNINDITEYNRLYKIIYAIARPGLYEFLDYIFENFTVGLWTAAQGFWMDFILSTVLCEYKNKFLFTWSRDKCYKGLYKKKEIIYDAYPLYRDMYILIDDNEYITGEYNDNNILFKTPDYQILIKKYNSGIDNELLIIKKLFMDFIEEKNTEDKKNINTVPFKYNYSCYDPSIY